MKAKSKIKVKTTCQVAEFEIIFKVDKEEIS